MTYSTLNSACSVILECQVRQMTTHIAHCSFRGSKRGLPMPSKMKLSARSMLPRPRSVVHGIVGKCAIPWQSGTPVLGRLPILGCCHIDCCVPSHSSMLGPESQDSSCGLHPISLKDHHAREGVSPADVLCNIPQHISLHAPMIPLNGGPISCLFVPIPGSEAVNAEDP